MSSKDNTYNGWKNYETWSIALFIDNEQEWYQYCRERMNEKDTSDYDKMVVLREFIEDNLLTSNLNHYQQQMMDAFLDEVNWMEVLKHYKEE